MYDLGIINGKIYLEGTFKEGNLYIKDEKIQEITSEFCECSKEIDAEGNYVLPGFIDPNVHFDMNFGNLRTADDFISGSRAAALGGITTVIDFLHSVNNSKEIETAFNERMEVAKQSSVDYSFHACAVDIKEEAKQFYDSIKSFGIPTVKVFTTHKNRGLITSDRTIFNMLETSKDRGIRVMVHAENDGMINHKANLLISDHEKSRPVLSEVTEVLKLAELAKAAEGNLYILHTSCGTTVEKLKEHYGDLLHKEIILESCPHYFTLTSEKYSTDEGFLYTVIPPLRNLKEVKKLIASFEEIDILASDHCSFNRSDKNHRLLNRTPMGIGEIGYSFVRMYRLFGEKVIDRYTKVPAVIHGLYPQKGTLLPGADADVVIFNSDREWSASMQLSEADYTTFLETPLRGKVLWTFVRGEEVVKEGKFIGGKGKYIKRKISL